MSTATPWPDPDPEHTDSDAGAVPERATRYGHNDKGGWEPRTLLRPEEGERVEAALAAKRAELIDDAEPGDTAEVSSSDALMGVVEDFLAGRTAAARDDRDRYMTHIHLETSRDGDSPVARFHLGDRLPDSLRRYLGCDGHIKAVFEVGGTPVSVGRAQHIVPDRTRRLVEHRDGACRVPGCGRRRRLHVHHLVYWEDGGRTDMSNLCCLCPRPSPDAPPRPPADHREPRSPRRAHLPRPPGPARHRPGPRPRPGPHPLAHRPMGPPHR